MAQQVREVAPLTAHHLRPRRALVVDRPALVLWWTDGPATGVAVLQRRAIGAVLSRRWGAVSLLAVASLARRWAVALAGGRAVALRGPVARRRKALGHAGHLRRRRSALLVLVVLSLPAWVCHVCSSV